MDCISIVINGLSIKASLSSLSLFCFEEDINNGISG